MDKFLDAFWNAIDIQKEEIAVKLADNLPRYFGALMIVLGGILAAYISYKLVSFLYNKFSINNIIDKLEIDFFNTDIDSEDNQGVFLKKKIKKKLLTETINIEKVLSKSLAYYIFLIFFRLAIVHLGTTEVERFLSELIAYLPNLFIGIFIGFFGLRFADSVYDIVYNALSIGKQKTSAIIAMGAKVLIIFFTLMLVLNYTKILDTFIINAIFIGFISMLTIALGIAFGLGGKKTAEDILNNLKK